MDNEKFCVGGSKIVIEFHHQIFAGYSSLEINVAKNLSLINNSQAQTTVNPLVTYKSFRKGHPTLPQYLDKAPNSGGPLLAKG